MAYSLNKVQLIGNLGGDPEVRYTQAGKPVATLNLATSERWKDQQGMQQERTEWHRVVVFGKLAEIVQQYTHKGSKLYVEGQIRTNKWTDKQGQDRYTTEIVLSPFNSQLIILDSRQGGGQQGGYGGGQQQDGYGAGGQQGGYGGGGQQQGGGGYNSAPAPAPAAQKPADPIPASPEQAPMPDFDDDIPF